MFLTAPAHRAGRRYPAWRFGWSGGQASSPRSATSTRRRLALPLRHLCGDVAGSRTPVVINFRDPNGAVGLPVTLAAVCSMSTVEALRLGLGRSRGRADHRGRPGSTRPGRPTCTGVRAGIRCSSASWRACWRSTAAAAPPSARSPSAPAVDPAPGGRPVRQRRCCQRCGRRAAPAPDELSANAVAETTWKLLAHHADADHRDAARAIAEEIARMPSPDDVARHLPEYAGRR